MPQSSVRLNTARYLKKGLEREVWECSFSAVTVDSMANLTVFKPGSLEAVNTSLPPDQAAEKCFLAMSELPDLGIPTPIVLGHAAVDGEAAVLCKKVERTEWVFNTRIAAAHILSRLHNLQESQLSKRLQELARHSDPREYRTTGGQAPQPEHKRLVHGDYFSVNILPVTEGLCIIDWETFGWGDPMWDLGFLIGADRGLTDNEVEAVIVEYESGSAVDRHRLMWHRRRWIDYWKKREYHVSNKANAGGA
ncbi:MAG: aminoglycoside phosphotransferase family protein [Verrucomicrobia bacterium]|nr:aminoglycoside phosphotransferase family protein [Verrucomicrobiota bacterium]MBU4292102.1 aminoglycoside phosphotransferase family protein [Verrucomicrobiota bacterium]MBU4430033.1 aminoglycoside phosphotransferase family protein [Verrucomicrobiota bacterium]MBU4496985.1 aminoglycoside phosphotransferase family protein [Verrucomicrobiota bacterium]MCG2681960.1 aminoglycoside phosphotransferase family protein [Kiritimatiellia bacterium]